MPVIYERAAGCNGWTVGDWLINFDGGFVRRGLGGYLILAISDVIQLKANFTVAVLQGIFFLAYIIILGKLIYSKNINRWFLLMLLSPATLLFPVLDSSTAGRKEVLLFCLFAVYILYLHKRPQISKTAVFAFSFCLLVGTFFHELVFFYSPYFIFAAYLKSDIHKTAFHFSKALLVVAGSFLAIIPVYLFGQTINGAVICEGLLERGLLIDICKGVLEFPQNFDTVSFFKEKGYFLPYTFAFVLGLLPFFLFINNSKNLPVKKQTIFWASLICLLFSLPLFVLAIDWGRWINIHLMLLLFTFTLLLNNNTLPQPEKRDIDLTAYVKNAFLIAISACYILLWYVPGCCNPDLLQHNFSRFAYQKISALLFLQ